MRAIGYIRVSTEEQARDGVSLAAQEEKIRGYAALYGIDLVRVEADAGISAKSLARPGVEAALGALDAALADGVIIAKLDRLTRSVRDWGALIDGYFGTGAGAGKQLWSVGDSIDTTSAAGRLVLNVLMGVAQWEREVICERTRDALGHKQRRGERVGTIPIGSRLAADGRSLEIDPDESAGLARIYALSASGMGSRAIARQLLAEGLMGRGDKPWPESTVRKLLPGRPR